MAERILYVMGDKPRQQALIVNEVFLELARARGVFPLWPVDVVQATAVMLEEAGEVLKAANEVCWGQKEGTMADVRKEVIQTMAMCLRLLTETPGLVSGDE